MTAIYVGGEDRKYVHSERLPIDCRALIVGASGCGKTCLLIRLLLEHNLLNYDKLYVFARTLYQPQYQILRTGIENRLSKEDIIQTVINFTATDKMPRNIYRRYCKRTENRQ